ncbi:trypsin-like serine peptidase [Streptomyces sioyaensis]|uniref:trypsin-like serine peptidase n=1 Tax=Streptomyces sioyaensis TaxID=67364 RepID=UPI003D71014E
MLSRLRTSARHVVLDAGAPRRSQGDPAARPECPGDPARHQEENASSRLGRLSAPPTAPANKAATRGDSKAGAAVNKARPWGRAGKQPALTTGRLFYRLPDGSGHTCSASVIHASNKNTLWTAGHCVHPGGGGDGKFYDPDYMTFAPDDDGGRAPHGLWEAAYVNTTKGWADDGDFAQDVAAVEVRPQSDRGNIQEFAGSQGYHFGYGQDFSNVTFLGYPAAGNGRSFPGDQLTYCRDNTEDASGWWWDERLQMVCDMGQGSSGGPWIDDLNGDGLGYIVGAMSHVYDPDTNDPDNAWSDPHGFSSNHGDGAINIFLPLRFVNTRSGPVRRARPRSGSAGCRLRHPAGTAERHSV